MLNFKGLRLKSIGWPWKILVGTLCYLPTGICCVEKTKPKAETYPEFQLHGPTAIDFKLKEGNICKDDDLCKFNLKNHLNNKETKLGFVFNLDEHWKSGSHWVALYIDLVDKHVYYFDSAGDRCPTRIKKIYHKLNSNNDFKFSSNYGIRHQKGKTECGIYVIYFILTMLKKNNYKLFNDRKNLIPDIQMENHRHKYFNKL